MLADPYYTEVVDVFDQDGFTCLELMESVFLPQGPGDLKDEGTIAGLPVDRIFLKEGRLIHGVAGGDFFKGMRVKVTLDMVCRQENQRQLAGLAWLTRLLEESGRRVLQVLPGRKRSRLNLDAPLGDSLAEELSQIIYEAILSGQARDLYSCLLFPPLGEEAYLEAVFGKTAHNYGQLSAQTVLDLSQVLGLDESELPFRVRLLQEEVQANQGDLAQLRQDLVRAWLRKPELKEELILEYLEGEAGFIQDLAKALAQEKKSSLLVDLRQGRIYGNIFKEGCHGGDLLRKFKKGSLRGAGGARGFVASADDQAELMDLAEAVYEELER